MLDGYDLLVIGGGINGTGIARDAAGRGLRVALAERGDLACATSSASSKLIHGGIRYLEHGEFGLVREALEERETLLRIAPHLMHPLRFVLPHVPAMRPALLIRAGLLLYDRLARRSRLRGAETIDLRRDPRGRPLGTQFRRAFVYSDCLVDDARLVVANARDAADRGAAIFTRTECISAARNEARWNVTLQCGATLRAIQTKAIVNVAGPWVKDVAQRVLGLRVAAGVRLVQGSHIILPRLYEGDSAYTLQHTDRRIVFMIPYEGAFTLIGTTDVPFNGDPANVDASESEIAYLLAVVNRYVARPVARDRIVAHYSGVRPLYDDGSANPSSVTRDYVFRLDGDAAMAPALSVFGGKLTTYRRLAESALESFRPWFAQMRGAWTAHAPLPGGDIAGDIEARVTALAQTYAELPGPIVRAIARRHGSRAAAVLGDARSERDLGEAFGGTLYEREIAYLRAFEWASSAQDVLWRRTKAALHMTAAQRERVSAYFNE